MYKTILVATDGSELSDKALQEATNLLDGSGAKLVLFHATPLHLPPLTEGLSDAMRPEEREQARKTAEEQARTLLSSAAAMVKSAGTIEQRFTVSNSPFEAIIEAANNFGCDLIVMASHGRRGLSGVLLGSETQKVLTHSKIPVLVVR